MEKKIRFTIIGMLLSLYSLSGFASLCFTSTDTIAPIINCENQMYDVNGNCHAVVELRRTATDTGDCAEGSLLYWEVYVDLEDDGSQDLLYSSFYTGSQGLISPITIDGVIHEVRQYTIAPTTSGLETTFTLPEPIQGRNSNHKIVWKVSDACGNVSICDETFTVLDRKSPTPVCNQLTNIIVMAPDSPGYLKPMAELWASDFLNRSYDNCTASNELLFTFDNLLPQRTLAFDSAGYPMSIDHPHFFNENGGVASAVNPNTSAYKAVVTQYQSGNLQLWIPALKSSVTVWMCDYSNPLDENEILITVWDGEFNSDECLVDMYLICNHRAIRIDGNIKTFDGRGVANVAVNMFEYEVSTDIEGNYSLPTFLNNIYTISAAKTGDFMNGVSTLDLILMQRHILGINKLDNPYKWIAADVNNDGKISASDLTELRKLILGVTPSFAKNPSWRFPIKSQTLDLNNPFNFKEIIAFNTSGEYMDSDFIAVKIGDVNGNVSTNIDDPAIERRSNQHVVLSVEDKKVRAGEVVAVPIMASDFKEVMGYQFTMQLKDATFQGIESGVIDVDANNLGVLENGVVTMSFASHEAFSLEEGNVLFTLMLKADKVSSIKEMIAVTSDVTAAESYHADFEVGTIRLDVRIPSTSSIKLLQNEPNPFKGETIIQFDMPHAEKVILRIYDVTGKMIMERTVLATVGRNHEVLSSEPLGTTGLLYYTLESGAFTATRKMIVME